MFCICYAIVIHIYFSGDKVESTFPSKLEILFPKVNSDEIDLDSDDE